MFTQLLRKFLGCKEDLKFITVFPPLLLSVLYEITPGHAHINFHPYTV
jgi:hypothetical protein